MTILHRWILDGSLVLTAIACWLGVIGMLRMREPMQALHYMSLPAVFGSVLLTIAVALQTGASQATVKCAVIAAVLIGINSIVTHATARAFRVREVGHWEPRPGDDIDWLGGEPRP